MRVVAHTCSTCIHCAHAYVHECAHAHREGEEEREERESKQQKQAREISPWVRELSVGLYKHENLSLIPNTPGRQAVPVCNQ